jgi:hypothetical protein
LHQGGDDPRRFVVEVYDDSQPASRIEVAAVEVLASGKVVVNAVVGMGNGAEDEIDLVHELGAPQSEMQPRSGVEDDEAAIWVCCGGIGVGHR